MSEHQLILCNCPDQSTAEQIAQLLIEEELAACVNISLPIISIYRWEGEIQTATESLISIKSRAHLYPEIEKRIKELHPYDLPEIIAIPIKQGSPEYLKWIDNCVRTQS